MKGIDDEACTSSHLKQPYEPTTRLSNYSLKDSQRCVRGAWVRGAQVPHRY